MDKAIQIKARRRSVLPLFFFVVEKSLGRRGGDLADDHRDIFERSYLTDDHRDLGGRQAFEKVGYVGGKCRDL